MYLLKNAIQFLFIYVDVIIKNNHRSYVFARHCINVVIKFIASFFSYKFKGKLTFSDLYNYSKSLKYEVQGFFMNHESYKSLLNIASDKNSLDKTCDVSQ